MGELFTEIAAIMNNFGTVTEPGVVRMERTLPATVERVWVYLTDPAKRATWLAGGTMSREPGGVFELRFEHSKLSGEAAPERFIAYRQPHVQKSRVVHYEAPRLLIISWGSESATASEVSFELTPQGDATLLLLTHRRLPDRKEMLSVASGWHAHLDVLDDMLHGRAPQRFWSNLAAIEAAYEERIEP